VISSASDIYGLLSRDPILGALATVRIVESRPALDGGDGVYIYIKKYPSIEDFEATWNIWIIDHDENPLDVIIAQIRKLLPRFEIIEQNQIIRATTTELRTDRTELEPVKVAPELRPATIEDIDSRFDELSQSIEDRMLLVGPGRPGKDGRDGVDGRDGDNGLDGHDMDATEVELGDLSDVLIDDAKRGQVLTYDGQDWVPEYVTKRHSYGSGGLTDAEVTIIEGLLETGEPMGHSNRSESVMSFDDTTRTFTIAPVGDTFKVWVKGKRFIIDSPRQVQIPDTTDLYYIYFDENGDLLYKTQFFTFSSDGFTSYIYWDADENKASYFGEERHGIVLDWQTHEYLHRTRGASIANGFDISNYTLGGTGTLESDVQFDISNGTFFDEDIKIDISHSATPTANSFQQILQGPAELPVLYRLGNVWKFDAATEIPVRSGPSHTYYNPITASTGALVEAASGRHLNYYVMATNNLRAPVVSLMGQNQYVNIASAEAESFSDLLLEDFPSKEFRFLYKLVLRTSNYTNSTNAIIEKIQDIRYYSDIPSALIT
jgi:hypothetical protein